MLLRLVLLPLTLLIGSCATVSPAASPQAQQQGFVIAANPLAARAGMEVLERGGSAVDAAIAVQAMLSLVEPQSSGRGGFHEFLLPLHEEADHLRRPGGGAGSGDTGHVPRSREEAAAVQHGGAERPGDRRSRGGGDALHGAQRS